MSAQGAPREEARRDAVPGPAAAKDMSFSGRLARFGGIEVMMAATALGFAYAGGWLDVTRLSPAAIVDALEERGGDPAGYRRNHAKGVCIAGRFDSSGAGAALSRAGVFAPGSVPVLGRLATASGDPHAADATNRVRSMALLFRLPRGQEWRTAMNSSPVFAVATPAAFYAQAVAARVDPATGKPDPDALRRFAAAHPETRAFADWAATAPWLPSFAGETFHSLNAFRFVDARGGRRFVRWEMVPETVVEPVTQDALAHLGPDFLRTDLEQRLASGPLRWSLVATIAAPGDPVEDPTRAWPADRQRVALGTLVVEHAAPQETGPCRDVNFDPLVLPDGIEPSDDPILLARSPVYWSSFDRRAAEVAR